MLSLNNTHTHTITKQAVLNSAMILFSFCTYPKYMYVISYPFYFLMFFQFPLSTALYPQPSLLAAALTFAMLASPSCTRPAWTHLHYVLVFSHASFASTVNATKVFVTAVHAIYVVLSCLQRFGP